MKPIILTIDDDPGVLIAVKRDLERQYEKRFRIVGSDSGVKALELVQKLKVQNEVLALAIADQRMPLMTGVEFLQHLTNIFPDAKRVLLTNYADREVSVLLFWGRTMVIDTSLELDPPGIVRFSTSAGSF